MAQIHTALYNRFAGVDFGCDPSKVESHRSPYARNILSDDRGYPEKRVGWRRMLSICDSEEGINHTVNFICDKEDPKYATLEEDGFELIPPDGRTAAYETAEYRNASGDTEVAKFLAMYISNADQAWKIKVDIPNAGRYIATVRGFDDSGRHGMNTNIYLGDSLVGNYHFSGGNGVNGYSGVVTRGYTNEFQMQAGPNILEFKCAKPNEETPNSNFKNRVSLISITFTRVDEHPLPINSISYFAAGDCYIVHAGRNLYKWAGDESTPSKIPGNINNAKSKTLVFQGKMLILTGREYLIFDGEKVIDMNKAATVPYIISGRTVHQSANATSSAGHVFQPINMLTSKVKIGFTVPADNISTIDLSGLGLTTVIEVSQVGSDGSLVSLENYDVTEYGGYATKITMANTFSESSPAGTDTVFVIGERAGVANRISECTVMGEYSNRVFFAGNPNYPDMDWACMLKDPLYIADISYTDVGGNESLVEDGVAIAGYARFGNGQLVLKRSHGQESAVFLRTSQLTDDAMIFPIAQSIIGTGVVANDSIAVLNDDPLFLTRNGVFAVASRDMTSEKMLRARSSRVNARLCKEKEFEKATATVWNGYYLLFINGNVYVADSRQKSYLREGSEDFEYEWYFWDNIPARVVCAHDDALYFGDEYGCLYRFNTDMLSPRGGYSLDAYSDDGEPIVAEWSTPLSDDGDFNRLKHVRRRGSGVHIKSYDRGDLEICVVCDRSFERRLNFRQHGILDFANLDFNHFTFNTYPHGFIPFDSKVKDYRLIQIICRNAQNKQGFGVYGIERRYVYGYNAK